MANNQRVVVQKMALNKIKLGKNSRLSVSKEELDGLMQSIKEVGLLQPIGVAKNGTGYEICYGNRRFMACSKLGFTNIPVIVHERKKESDIDLKNLTENIQRRNIGLAEAGRYIELLKKEGLTTGEIGVRLGVTRGYISACLQAYEEVPAKFRNDLELAIGAGSKRETKKGYGKIAVTSAKAIINAAKSYGLDEEQKEKLFSAAKSDERFLTENTRKYAAALKSGAKDPIAAVKPLQHINCQFWMSKDDVADLQKRFVDDGPFRSLNGLFKAVLSGKKSLKINVVEKLD